MKQPFPPVLLFACPALLLASCNSLDEFTILGYTTRSQHAPDIRTIRVPIFQNRTFVRGIEFELTEAVIKQIEAKTPWKVVQSGDADTELLGTVIGLPKRIILQNRLNEIREAELTLAVEVIWRDLRTGQVLTCPPGGMAPAPAAIPADPLAPPSPPPVPIVVQRSATYIPELGQSNASARQEVVNDLARQIVAAMEVPW